MNTEVTTQPCNTISRAKLLSVVRKIIDGEPVQDPEPNPAPRGFLDAIIRTAVDDTIDYRKAEKELAPPPYTPPGDPAPFFSSALDTGNETRLSFFARFKPAIYDVIGGPNSRFGLAALNPQPLPPRLFFLRALAQVIVARVGMLHDLGGGKDGEERGIIIVSGYVDRLTDELCPDKYRLRWPRPGPPPWWFASKLSGLDLVVLAAEWEQAAQETYADGLRRVFDKAGARFAEAGMARL